MGYEITVGAPTPLALADQLRTMANAIDPDEAPDVGTTTPTPAPPSNPPPQPGPPKPAGLETAAPTSAVQGAIDGDGSGTRDTRGLLWDKRIHTRTKTTVAAGTWRQKRETDEDLLAAVEAALIAEATACGALVTIAVPVSSQPPLPGAPPSPPDETVAPTASPPVAPAVPVAPAAPDALGSLLEAVDACLSIGETYKNPADPDAVARSINAQVKAAHGIEDMTSLHDAKYATMWPAIDATVRLYLKTLQDFAAAQ